MKTKSKKISKLVHNTEETMFKYTVRSASGRIIGKALTIGGAKEIQRESFGGENSYIKTDRDSINPFREQISW